MAKNHNEEGKPKKSKRFVAEEHYGWEGMKPKMKTFWAELYTELGREPEFTSGKRTADQKKGTSYKTSTHNDGGALDIGVDLEAYNFLMNTPKGLGLLVKHGLGVLDETDPEMMKKTKATGAHFHIGSDPASVKYAKQRYNIYTEKGELDPIFSYAEQAQKNAPKENEPETNFNYGIGRLTGGLEDFQKQVEKEKIKEEKEEKSEARKEITKAKEEITLGKQFFESLQAEKQQSSKVRPEPSDYRLEDPVVIEAQNSLPEMPSIFADITKLQDGGKVSTLGYRNDSPDKNEETLTINSPYISMKNVDHPVIGIDNLGNKKYMLPGKEYQFEGDRVQEFPVRDRFQDGGSKKDSFHEIVRREVLKDKGGTVEQWNRLKNSIAYHESKLDPKAVQKTNNGTGPGRGLYQFEPKSLKTAAKRLINYTKTKGIEVPAYVKDVDTGKIKDATKLSPAQQETLLLGDYRMKPNADLGKYFSGEQKEVDFWLEGHWGGQNQGKDVTKKRRDSFNRDLAYIQEYMKDLFGVPRDITANLREEENKKLQAMFDRLPPMAKSSTTSVSQNYTYRPDINKVSIDFKQNSSK